jgi:ABC-type transport system involved in cytochrome bd biosynthesis fused ATPase/permease subunit
MNTKTVLACTAVIVAFALIVAPLAVSEDAFAKKRHSHSSNHSVQVINQHSDNEQESHVSSGGNSEFSGNNIHFNFQDNDGSNTANQNNN